MTYVSLNIEYTLNEKIHSMAYPSSFCPYLSMYSKSSLKWELTWPNFCRIQRGVPFSRVCNQIWFLNLSIILLSLGSPPLSDPCLQSHFLFLLLIVSENPVDPPGSSRLNITHSPAGSLTRAVHYGFI